MIYRDTFEMKIIVSLTEKAAKEAAEDVEPARHIIEALIDLARRDPEVRQDLQELLGDCD